MAGSPGGAERERLRVTKAIRSAIQRIAAADPALGGHFSGSVRTGYVCSYDPERPVDWTT